MKYAQLIIGLLAGTALGGSVVAATDSNSGSKLDSEQVKAIVRQVISDEPKLIMESVQKFQMDQQKKVAENASQSLKDSGVRDQVFNDPNAASVGPKDAKKVLVEFFDYNCGACKFMFKNVAELLEKDKEARVIFHEYPIFGPGSETNSRIGLAVNRLYPEKYYDFHVKMMTQEGRVDEKGAMAIVKGLGLNVAKVKAESQKPEVAAILENNRKLGEQMHIQGTPTLVIGDDIIPHALAMDELETRLNAASGASPAAAEPAPKAEAPKEEPKEDIAPAVKAKTPDIAPKAESKAEPKVQAPVIDAPTADAPITDEPKLDEKSAD